MLEVKPHSYLLNIGVLAEPDLLRVSVLYNVDSKEPVEVTQALKLISSYEVLLKPLQVG